MQIFEWCMYQFHVTYPATAYVKILKLQSLIRKKDDKVKDQCKKKYCSLRKNFKIVDF